MNVISKKRRKKGFTLGEVLATVAILLVLMVVAVPSIFMVRKNLHQKALDHKAELIYTTVQNNLTRLRANGNSEYYGAGKAKKLDAYPLDMDREKTLYYVTSEKKGDPSDAASALLTEDLIDTELYGQYWVIEYDPESASVYAVFYSETRKDYGADRYNALRFKENRLNDGARVGYYGGDSIDGGISTTLAPKIIVKNEEKLQITITSKRPDENALSYMVTLEDTEGHKLNLNYKPDASGMSFVHEADDCHLAETAGLDDHESGSIFSNLYTLNLTLDDLTEEKTRFASLYGKNSTNAALNRENVLTAGTELTVSVTVKSKSSLVDGLSASVKTNSLFGDDSTENEAEILYGRHLQNLDEGSAVTQTITGAVQKSDIHFEKSAQQAEGEDLSSWYSCYQEKTFHPVTNPYLIRYEGMSGEEEEEQKDAGIHHSEPLLIRCLTTEKTEKAGLFGLVPDQMQISSVRLTGARVSSTGGADTFAGVIAAEAAGSITLKNCQVYLEPSDVTGKTDADVWMDGASSIGGLIGISRGKAMIEDCFASTVIGTENTDICGGLIGTAAGGAQIQNSYTGSYLSGKVTAGLIGQGTGTVSAKSCYTAGYQKAEQTAGGFLAEKQDDLTEIQNSYSAVTWLKPDEEKEVTRYSLIPGNGQHRVENAYFLNGGTDYYLGDEKDQIGEKVDFAVLGSKKMADTLGQAFVSPVSATYPYNLKHQKLTDYSYPALAGMDHYGDWEADFEAGSLVYYEVYQEEGEEKSFGFYHDKLISTLREDAVLVGDGYGILFEEADNPTEPFAVIYQDIQDNGEPEEKKISLDPERTENYTVKGTDKTYVVYLLPAEVVNVPAQKDSFYQKLTVLGASAAGFGAEEEESVSGEVYYYNPHFAKTAVGSADGVKAPDTPEEISIRTARQLYQLSKNDSVYAKVTEKSTYLQELDLSYETYEWKTYAQEEEVTVQAPIGEKEPFTAVYDGKCHKITGISFSSKEPAVGFIGNNRGTIQNVFLVHDYQKNGENPYLAFDGDIVGNKTVYIGAIAGKNSGKIENCAVCGFELAGQNHTVFVRENGSLYFGGITGSNQGTIVNCQTDLPSVNVNVLYGTAYIGGFAGENASGGKIRDSYAIGKASAEYAKGAKAVLGGFTAKNVGSINNSYCALALTAEGSAQTYGFAPKGGSVSSCRYLSGGAFYYLGELYAFDNTEGSGQAVSYTELKAENTSVAEYHSGTVTEEGYPYQPVVKNANNETVHFGNWQTASDLGTVGVIYWEKEEGGSNSGYHFSYIGYMPNAQNPSVMDKISGSTLCHRHDDGGIITEYGYGWYYSEEAEKDQIPSASAMGFQTGKKQEEASSELTRRLPGFHVEAYRTAPSIGKTKNDTDSYMKMTSSSVNGIWTITDTRERAFTFTVNPFFANAMQYGTGKGELIAGELNIFEENGTVTSAENNLALPGEEEKPYEIRSAHQLQYLNWNYKTQDAVTTLTKETYRDYMDAYTYLGQMSMPERTEQNGTDGKQNWIQTHDVDADMDPDRGSEDGRYFTQIGSLYDEKEETNKNQPNEGIYLTCFTGSFDGNTYCIKNMEINSTNTVVGLFGTMIGAKVRNVVLYSDKGNMIQRSRNSSQTWYALGGLCGLAAVGKGNSVEDTYITNCTVSGYNICDNSISSSWGDGNIGGLSGICVLNLHKCTAVNTIVLNCDFEKKKANGVSVRAAGLVGGMRGTVAQCYTGGEITCTDECLNSARPENNKWGAKIFLGGITGGVYLKDEGSLRKLLGDQVPAGWNQPCNDNNCNVAVTEICDCYTYLKMPGNEKKVNRIDGIAPIGCNGEIPAGYEKNHHVRVAVRNCYYYENHMTAMKIYQGEKNGNSKLPAIPIDPTGYQGLTWKQMAGEEAVFENRYLKDILGFESVTTYEYGHTVKGKYSYPGIRRSLDGENYPFPTILTQSTDVDQETVNVHYGEWPLEGIYWEESRAAMDIFEDLVTDGENDGVAWKQFILKDPGKKLNTGYGMDDFRFTYSLGEDLVTQITSGEEPQEDVPDLTYGVQFLEEQDLIAEVVDIHYDSENDGFTAKVKAYRTGTEVITVSATGKDNQEYRASFTLTVTADLIAYTSSVTVNQQVGEVTDLRVYAVPMSMYSGDEPDQEIEITDPLNAENDVPQPEEQTVNTYEIGAEAKMIILEAAEENTESFDTSEEYSSEGETENDGTEEASDMDIQLILNEEIMEEEGEILTPYADVYTVAPEKDLADRMTWTVESDSQDGVNAEKLTDENGVFLRVTGLQPSEITLTITGIYTYEGIEYKTITWVDVITTEAVNQPDEADPMEEYAEPSDSEEVLIQDPEEDFIYQEEETGASDTIESSEDAHETDLPDEQLTEQSFGETLEEQEIIREETPNQDQEHAAEAISAQEEMMTEEILIGVE